MLGPAAGRGPGPDNSDRGGRITEWWAWHVGDGSQMAVVLGPAALCQADPGIKPDGNPGHRVRTAPFVAGSLRVTASGDPTSGSAASAGAPGAAMPPLLDGVLSAEFRASSATCHGRRRCRYSGHSRPARPALSLLLRGHAWVAAHLDRAMLHRRPAHPDLRRSDQDDCAVRGTSSWQATCYQATLAAPMPPPQRMAPQTFSLPWTLITSERVTLGRVSAVQDGNAVWLVLMRSGVNRGR